MKEFFSSPLGIFVIVVAALALLYYIFIGRKKNNAASATDTGSSPATSTGTTANPLSNSRVPTGLEQGMSSPTNPSVFRSGGGTPSSARVTGGGKGAK